MNQVASQMVLVEVVEVAIAKIVVGDILGKDVIDGHKDFVGYRHRSTLVPTARLETVELVTQMCPWPGLPN